MNATTGHWDEVWSGRDPDRVTWFQEVPRRSLALVRSVSDPDDGIADVGGGASRLVDHLLDLGYRDVTVVDLAEPALATSRRRLGCRSSLVHWEVADATTLDLGRTVDVWHDRAVFHFLVDAEDRAAYVDRVRAHLPIGGHVVIATFGPEGPERCSGLPTRRYDADGLAAEFGDDFELVAHEREEHISPAGDGQQFQYAVLRRVA